MKLLRVALLGATILSVNVAIGQTDFADDERSWYLEFNTFLVANALTINYEGLWIENQSGNFRINGRAGIIAGAIGEIARDDTVSPVTPFVGGLAGLSFIWGTNKHYFVWSFGILGGSTFGNDTLPIIYPLFELGWRFHPLEGYKFWKVGIGTNGLSLGVGHLF